jgi:glycosyltransferase involved in cell wall biosynthesis
VEGLSKKGIEVTVLYVKEWSKYDGIKEIDLDAEVIILNSPKLYKLLLKSLRYMKLKAILKDLKFKTKLHQELFILGKQLSRIIKERKFDFVHAHGIAAGALLAGFSKFHPFGVSAWGSDIYLAPKKYPYLKDLIRNTLSKANLIHVESEISALRVSELSKIDRERFLISTWGVDLDLYTKTGVSPMIIGGVNLTQKRIILSFRALEPIYQIDKIIKAYSAIYTEFPDAALVIGSNGTEKPNLEILVEELGISDRVIFTGFIENAQKRALLTNSLFYVQCPSSDGVAITVMEAMASGLPIVTSNVGENRILVEDGENGFLIDEPYEKNLSEMMRRLLLEPKLRNDMAKSSKKIAQEKHSRSEFLDRFIQRANNELSGIST